MTAKRQDHQIDDAVAALRRGECIGLPTETVYGLAADARNPHAVRRIFALKGRPADHPLIVHLPDAATLDDYARDIPSAARALAAHFWPGPLTLILNRQPSVPDEVTGGQPTVGLRMPAHPLAQQLLGAFGGGLAAPSANRFGRISPTTAQHVRDEFGDAVPIVLDGGDCEVGIESTIVDCSGTSSGSETGGIRILRPGSISQAMIEAVIGPLAPASASASVSATTDTPRVSGSLEKHYAPNTPMRLLPRSELAHAAEGSLLLALGRLPPGTHGLALPTDPAAYGQRLYAALRALDARDAREIRVEQPPSGADWLAIHDRLGRAAAGAGNLQH